jgi:hypothetical protein
MSRFTSSEQPGRTSQARALFRDFSIVLAVTTAAIAFINVAAAHAVPVPILSLIVPFDFGLTQTAIEAVHGGLTGSDTTEAAPAVLLKTETGAVAMTFAATFFAALIAATLAMYRRLRRTHAWRWSAHFE